MVPALAPTIHSPDIRFSAESAFGRFSNCWCCNENDVVLAARFLDNVSIGTSPCLSKIVQKLCCETMIIIIIKYFQTVSSYRVIYYACDYWPALSNWSLKFFRLTTCLTKSLVSCRWSYAWDSRGREFVSDQELFF